MEPLDMIAICRLPKLSPFPYPSIIWPDTNPSNKKCIYAPTETTHKKVRNAHGSDRHNNQTKSYSLLEPRKQNRKIKIKIINTCSKKYKKTKTLENNVSKKE